MPTTRSASTLQGFSLRLCAVAAACSLSACAQFDNTFGAKVDYRKATAKTQPLEVPPDLSQVARDMRYQPAGSVVSASNFKPTGQPSAAAPSGPEAVAFRSVAGYSIERDGQMRWLSTPLSPEQIWPQLPGFWDEVGLSITEQDSATGVMETDWAENRAKLPRDFIRGLLGSLADGLYSTGERDKYRLRLERQASGKGTDVYISHKGLQESLTGSSNETVAWQHRPSEPDLEVELLQRLMFRLAGKPAAQAAAADAAESTTMAAAPATNVPVRARLTTGEGGPALQMDYGFDRAWRRLGLALDRSGFSVEDRDRGQGVYFVRYVDPALAGKDEPGFFAKLFGGKDSVIGVSKYRVLVKSVGESSTARVLNSQGQPETGAAAERILKLLLEDVK
jgi:outer membrane protein assembly factor BamC